MDQDNRNKFVANKMRDLHGLERTPDQCGELLRSALAQIRQYMEEAGYSLPQDDEELLNEIRETLGPTSGL